MRVGELFKLKKKAECIMSCWCSEEFEREVRARKYLRVLLAQKLGVELRSGGIKFGGELQEKRGLVR